jgi:5-methylcytosine-specific restriction endonuclease McrA
MTYVHPALQKRREKQDRALQKRLFRKKRAREKSLQERRMGRKAPPALRRAVFRRDSHTCRYCGFHPATTIDHIIPFSKGGKTYYENLAAACKDCQKRKDNLLLDEIDMDLIPLSPLALEYERFWNERSQWGYFDDCTD